MRVGANEAGDDGLAGAVDYVRGFGGLEGRGFDALDDAFLDGDVDVLAGVSAGAVDDGRVMKDDGLLLGGSCECCGDGETAESADDGSHRASGNFCQA